MGKINVLFLLGAASIGGTERSAIITARRLNRRVFRPYIVITGENNDRFKKITKGLYVESIDRKDIIDFIKKKRIVITYSFIDLDDPTREVVKRACKLVQCVVFTKLYSKFNDANLMTSKTEHLKLKFINGGKLINDYVLYFPIDYVSWSKLKSSRIKPFLEYDGRIRIGRLARAEPSKWHFLIISILHIFKKKDSFKNFRFVFAGMPRLYRKYIEIVFSKELKNGSIVLIDELVSEEELARFYKSLDIFLQASWIGESFGCVIAESFSFGVPVMTDWKGFFEEEGRIRLDLYDTQIELVDNGLNGFYANHPLRVYELLQKADIVQLKKLGLNGAKKVRDLYEAGKITRNFENILLGEIMQDSEKHKKLIYPTREEIASYEDIYKQRLRFAKNEEKEIAFSSRLTYKIGERLWRVTEWSYIIVRKLLGRIGINLEGV